MMAQYKVITSLSEPIEPLPAFDGSSSLNFVNFSLIYNPEDVSRPLESSQVDSIEESIQRSPDEDVFYPWDQDSVRNLQQALNSQPNIHDQPLAYTTLWEPSSHPEESLDLSSTSTRPTTLHPRHVVMSHPAHQERHEERMCKVCGERAGKHSYYGGQACPSCRAFFRRSVQSGYNVTYYCVREGQCEVNLKTRKNCQACRYKKCEAAGMKTTWVLTEEERKLKFDGKGKKRRSSSGSKDNQMMKIKSENNSLLNEDDSANISNYVAASEYLKTSKVNDMDQELIRKIIRMVAFRATLDHQGQDQLMTVLKTRAEKFAISTQEMQSLCSQDQTVLLSTNLSMMMTLFTCSMFSQNLHWTGQLSSLLGTEEVDKLSAKLVALNVSGLDTLRIPYTDFFQGRFLTTEDESKHLVSLVTDIGSWHQDSSELVLLSLVLLFTADSLDLVESARVEETQLHFAVILQRLLSHRHVEDPGQARQRFLQAMLVIAKVREVTSLQERMLL